MNPASPTPRPTRRARGFTLIELMIVVVIIGILSAVAYPAYTEYVKRGYRSAVQTHLLELAQRQSEIMADSRAYATTIEDIGIPAPQAVSERYELSIEPDAPTVPPTFTITATPIAGTSQEGEDAFTIDSNGTKTPAELW